MTELDNIRKGVRKVKDLPREIAFARAALNANDPATIYWLAALLEREETDEKSVAV